ncbi:MAG TPA: DEAD/DEAH box helicase, partial [Pyrinomonadaceae bacterium]|nr:DEAD/DEAH box helicase [Pyrinomonadaceae bacterium]
MKALDSFHPAVRDWFLQRFPAPTEPQAQAWPAIKSGKHTLIAAPTGSGKTLAAFLSAIDDLVWKATRGELADETHIVYVSPLKALSNDIKINLEAPLRGIQQNLEASGISATDIRTLVRTGDTPAKDRAAMTKKPPHIIVTTPESLYILLTSDGGRKMLSTVRTLIVDEIHAMVDDKRGSHLSLSIERLEALVAASGATVPAAAGHLLPTPKNPDESGTLTPALVRIGLSATQKPIEEVARFLVGTANIDANNRPDCVIVDSGHTRRLDLGLEIPNSPLESLMSNEVWEEIYDRLATLIRQHQTTLVFVNTRRMAERVARHLGERLGDDNVTAHHGSLAREIRLSAEQRLKSGELSALVATASLELGIDIGAVDLVVQIGSTRAISTLLQRIGRSNHTVSGFPKGRIIPLSRDELIECTALIDSVRRGELDHLTIPEQPLDILAQQIVATAAPEEWTEDSLFEMVRRAYPFRNLKREKFDEIIRMLSEGFTTRRGRRGTYLHHDAVNHRIRGRRGARLSAITNGGAIPDTSDYRVILEPSETFVGTLNEDFAIESLAGDIFQLGNSSYEIKRVGAGEVRVLDAHGQPPSIPFWLGEAPGRSAELSASVSRLRDDIAQRLEIESVPGAVATGSSSSEMESIDPVATAPGSDMQDAADEGVRAPGAYGPAMDWLINEVGITQSAAQQIVEYLALTKLALGVMPTQENIVVERFFDENGSTHVVIHAPFGSRLNRAWGLALRKRFCRSFNFELQAAATEDSIVLSLGPTHSFPLDTIFGYLNSKSVCDVLTQALLNAPMFNIRWRWNATRALAIPRWRSGGKVAPQLQRMAAEDLLALVFPDQLACAENLTGPIEVPAHPLVEQTVRDCLEEAMDLRGLEELLRSIERSERNLIAREMNEPSPLAQEILTAKPYAFLDDAPAEERRTLAVMNRRFLDAETAADLGKLDQAAIDRVREEAWPQAENADELHDALMQLGFMTETEGLRSEWQNLFAELVRDRRATTLSSNFWVAAERLNQLRAIYPNASLNPPIAPPASYASESWTGDAALVEALRGRLEGLGPVTVDELAKSFSLPSDQIQIALAKLEGEGFAMQGQFTPARTTGRDAGAPAGRPVLQEWCSRRLLARIHRYTLNRLRREIEPVSAADFMRFLFVWQKVAPNHQVEGASSVAAILDQLEGFEAPAGSWESEILPARVVDYD